MSVVDGYFDLLRVEHFLRETEARKLGAYFGVALRTGAQFCHLHDGTPSTSPIIPDEIDEITILRKLALDSNPQVRLRAVDLLLDLKAKCAKSPNQAREQESERFLDALTDDECERLDAILRQLRDLKEEVRARLSSARPDENIVIERQAQNPSRNP